MAKTSPLYQRVGIVYNPDKDRAQAEYRRLKRWFEQRKLTVAAASKVTPAIRKVNFVVVLGGDGTVLQVARDIARHGVPILGVNVGRLGFLAATELAAMYRTLERVLSGEGRIESRTMLSVTGSARGKSFGPFPALNDCVLRSGATGRVLQLQA